MITLTHSEAGGPVDIKNHIPEQSLAYMEGYDRAHGVHTHVHKALSS